MDFGLISGVRGGINLIKVRNDKYKPSELKFVDFLTNGSLYNIFSHNAREHTNKQLLTLCGIEPRNIKDDSDTQSGSHYAPHVSTR
jgi:hypothetical protein